MPLIKPKPSEKYNKFMARFLKNKVSKKEYPDIKQRFAVGVSIWNRYKARYKRIKK